MAEGMSLGERCAALEVACEALDGLGGELWQVQGAELGPLMSLVDRLGERAGAARVAVLGEAVERGEAGPAGAGAHTWLRERAPSFRAGGSAQVVRVVHAVRDERYAALRDSVLAARTPVGNAACVVEEFERLRHRLHPEGQGPALECMTSLAETGGRREVRRVRQHLVARYGCEGEFQADQDRAAACRSLSQPAADGSGLFDYHLVVDAEAKAVIEGAVGALSAPRPVEGVPDLRPSGQRRMEALLDVVRRGVASAEGVATTTKAQLFVTLPLAELVAGVNAGTVLGSTDVGSLLGPETVRRLACDAAIIPTVLGSAGEVLDLGRRVRLFTEGQIRALWLRDRGCTFPGCGVPAAWCDGHHLWHWVDGGPSDLDNAALLCARHHTVVHSRRLFAEVVDGRVEWDLTRGSYDHWLATRAAAAGDRASGHVGHGVDVSQAAGCLGTDAASDGDNAPGADAPLGTGAPLGTDAPLGGESGGVPSPGGEPPPGGVPPGGESPPDEADRPGVDRPPGADAVPEDTPMVTGPPLVAGGWSLWEFDMWGQRVTGAGPPELPPLGTMTGSPRDPRPGSRGAGSSATRQLMGHRHP